MYKIIVGQISKARQTDWTLRNENPYSVWDGKALAAQVCRISALSSADYCLRSRIDVDWCSVAWKGNKQEISHLFEAEQLDSAELEQLDPCRDYAVIFIGFSWAGCA